MDNNVMMGSGRCQCCGCNLFEAIADARALGLEQEFRAGIYTCCEIDRWADEQWHAWFEIAVAENAALKLELQAYATTAMRVLRPNP